VSDSFQVLVAQELGPWAAEQIAPAVIDWMVAQGVIVPERTDCVLDSDLGHAPGPGASRAHEPRHKLVWLRTNGVTVSTGRRVFHAGQNGISLECPACADALEPGEEWPEAVGRWVAGDDGASFMCPTCGQDISLQDWEGEWRWAFGHLGITFWNWPPLSESFIQALATYIRSPLTVVLGRL
jgi:predicted RNA-binding Zn-ribbon protein involved in translation (DUF1610 family)